MSHFIPDELDSAADVLAFVRDKARLSEGLPIDVDSIARALGIPIEFDHFYDRPEVIGEITFREKKPLIRINAEHNSSAPRRRFTIAHEIGHFILHSSKTHMTFVDSAKTMSRSESYWDSYESEANSFASQLLMPRDLVVSAGQLLMQQHMTKAGSAPMAFASFTEQMSKMFNVSNRAMQYRLQELRIRPTAAQPPFEAAAGLSAS